MPAVLFLPGILAPATVRYAPLLAELDDVEALTKDLEVYAADVPADYSIELEVAGIARYADAVGLERFHLFGHSAGGACALAFAAEHPARVLSLALDEPATDFSDEDLSHPRYAAIAAARTLPEEEALAVFLRHQVGPDVALPEPSPGPPPPWMASRPAGMQTFVAALLRHRIDPARYEAVDAPVLFTYGSLTHPAWAEMRDRLAGRLPDFHAERYEGLHHLTPLHQTDPSRAAAVLRAHWARADETA